MLEEELKLCKAGAASSLFYGILASTAVAFVVGILDGYLRPKKCN